MKFAPVYNDYKLFEGGGQEVGKLELLKTDVKTAYEFAKKEFAKYDRDIDVDIPNFKKNYEFAQSTFKMGHTKRKDMPVIDSSDVNLFKKRLEGGVIDIHKPFAKATDSNKPFPEGLSKKQADEWLENGLKDGEKKDDSIKVKVSTEKAGRLRPIQRQVYADKSIATMARFGVKGAINFYKNSSTFITSKDNYLIDGHHRFLGALLIGADTLCRSLFIQLPIDILLPMSTAYGDAIGNERNK